MEIVFYIKYNYEREHFEFKKRCEFSFIYADPKKVWEVYLTYQESKKILEALNIIVSAEMEKEYSVSLSRINEKELETDVHMQLYSTEKGWRLSEINAGESDKFRALSFQKHVMIKQLLEQYCREIDDEGLLIAQENAEVYYERRGPNPHVIKKPINHDKKAWSFTCSSCKGKVKSTEISNWWAVGLYREIGKTKYCCEECAEQGLEAKILEVKTGFISSILYE